MQALSIPTPKNARPLALVVDDHPGTRSILKRQLEAQGFVDVQQAASGKQAIEAVNAAAAVNKEFALITMDMQMESNNAGQLAAQHIKSTYPHIKTKIIAHTSIQKEDERIGEEFDYHFEKGNYKQAELLGCFKKIFQTHSNLEEKDSKTMTVKAVHNVQKTAARLLTAAADPSIISPVDRKQNSKSAEPHLLPSVANLLARHKSPVVKKPYYSAPANMRKLPTPTAKAPYTDPRHRLRFISINTRCTMQARQSAEHSATPLLAPKLIISMS